MLMWGGWVGLQTLWWSLGLPRTNSSQLFTCALGKQPSRTEVEKILLEKFFLLHQLGKTACVII